MGDIEVISTLKHCSDTKRDRVIKSPGFLFAAIWLHLTHSLLGLKYMCKSNTKHLDIDKYIIITFP